MKQLLLLLTFVILFCNSIFAEQREKIRTATDYTKFFAQKVKNYSAYRAVSQEELRNELRNENGLYEININYFGSIVCKSKILMFKKFLKELPESGKVGFVVTVDRKQEYQRVYFEVLDQIYEYLYDSRKRSKIEDDKLDQQMPYFVICIAKGRYDEKITPIIDTISTIREVQFEELPVEEKIDSVIEVVETPQETIKVKPKKKAKAKIVVKQQVVPDESEKEGEFNEMIVIGLVIAVLLILVVVLKVRRRNKKR